MALPVMVRGSLLGAFRVSRRREPFSDEELELVRSFVRHASIALENARLLRQARMSEEQYRSLFTACLDTVYMSTPSGLFLDVNPAALLLMDLDRFKEVNDALGTVLARLRALGLEVAIDDFGTGYASLAYLADLPADTLKIDRSFVHDLVARPRHAAIVRSTVELAHSLGLRVVAEGVEDAQTWDALAALGCDEAQGYLMGHPMPDPELAAWLIQTSEQAA